MDKLKLFSVEVEKTMTIVVAARDRKHAWMMAADLAEEAERNGDGYASDEWGIVSATDIESREELPDDWNESCLVYGDHDGDLTAGDVLATHDPDPQP